MKSNGLLFVLVLSGIAVSAARADAQVLKWAEGFPTAGTKGKTVSVQGTVDLTKAPLVTAVNVWVFENGHRKPAVPVMLGVDLTGKWGPSNAPQGEGKGGAEVHIVVETVGGATTYALVGHTKSKEKD